MTVPSNLVYNQHDVYWGRLGSCEDRIIGYHLLPFDLFYLGECMQSADIKQSLFDDKSRITEGNCQQNRPYWRAHIDDPSLHLAQGRHTRVHIQHFAFIYYHVADCSLLWMFQWALRGLRTLCTGYINGKGLILGGFIKGWAIRGEFIRNNLAGFLLMSAFRE